MLLLCFYCPVEFKGMVKTALFEAGGGKIGDYDSCCFETLGTGQFRPLKGSQPFLGKLDSVEVVPEVKIELVCEKEKIEEIIKALKSSHPYETPAYHVIEILEF